MWTREFVPGEWAAFFDGFNRTHQGHLMTLEVRGDPPAGPTTVGRELPFVRITAEPRWPRPELIEIRVGTSNDEHLEYTVHSPSRLRVSQAGCDGEAIFLIDSPVDGTTVVDFSHAAAPKRGAEAKCHAQ